MDTYGVGGSSCISWPGVSGVVGTAAARGDVGDVATGGGVLLMAGL